METQVRARSGGLPKISIITPSYNQAGFIRRTIDSVLDQDYPALEYIIIDGGSSDGTVDILHEYDGRIQWISEKDSGQSDAINKGLRRASGEILAFLNSDDVYEPGALPTVGQYFSNHPGVNWVTGKCYTIDRHGKKTRPLITQYKNLWLRIHCDRALYVLNFISQPATFWRREITRQVGWFNQALFYTMDYDYWLRILAVTHLAYIDAYLASFRYYSDSKSGSTTRAQFDEQFQVAQQATASRALLKLHSLHNLITIFFYQHTSVSASR